MPGQGEFEFIRSKLAPLSLGAAGAAGLTDDGAVLDLGPGERLAVTADTLIEGRHFPDGEDAALAARKALRVNLSDLAAMGATPFAYMTSVVWPGIGYEARADGFVAGLSEDQARFGVRLIGGDTTCADAPWTIAITAFGRLPAATSLRRSRGKAGDVLIATGTIGDAGLGLKIALHEWSPDASQQAKFLMTRLQLPEPRIKVGLAARNLAHAAIDISDGLLSEARHLAQSSGLAACVDLDRMPLSEAGDRWLRSQRDQTGARLELAACGDDYELLLAVPPRNVEQLIEACEMLGVRASSLGALTVREDEASLSVTAAGAPVAASRLGFTQF